MPLSDIIVVERLVKRYGARAAVRGVSFSVKAGEIVGLLGPNGSGKSTILRILTGYLRSSSGSVRIGGVDVTEHAARNYVGYVPEDAPLYDWMRVGEFLQFMAAIKGVPARAAGAAIASVCAQLDLESVVRLPVGKLSRGYRQRVAIAQALLNDPPILVFDEPTNALDAYQVIGIRELIRSLAGRRTVLVASHVLTEIEKVANRIMILRDGDLLTADATSEGSRAPRFQMRIVGPRQAGAGRFAQRGRCGCSGSPSRFSDGSGRFGGHSQLSGRNRGPSADRRAPRPVRSRKWLRARRAGRAKTRSRAHIPRSYAARHRGTGPMRAFLALLKKEEMALFTSPIAYVVMSAFLVIMGYTFTLTLFLTHVPTLVHLFIQIYVLFLLTVPIITMRLVAEERRLRTLEILLTSPLSEVSIILAKFLASLSLIVVMLLLSYTYALALAVLGAPDWGPIYSGYVGLFLLGAALVAVGLMTSSMVSNQVIAALLSLSIFLVLWIIDYLGWLLPDPFNALFVNLSLLVHFRPFATGSLFLSDAGYFLSVTLLGLFVSVRALAWR